ncbi:MAG: ribbon-helix-helix domain-containing protein, partial [Synergistaceae bacterium]|nr:ribbon-helix-helix domain-containing protein [Synergistaceae bacterium]
FIFRPRRFKFQKEVVNMSGDTLKIYKKNNVRGEDYKTFSIRIKGKTVAALDALAEKSNRSRNDLISTILEQEIGNIEAAE